MAHVAHGPIWGLLWGAPILQWALMGPLIVGLYGPPYVWPIRGAPMGPLWPMGASFRKSSVVRAEPHFGTPKKVDTAMSFPFPLVVVFASLEEMGFSQQLNTQHWLYIAIWDLSHNVELDKFVFYMLLDLLYKFSK
jgi:hypothetical protein